MNTPDTECGHHQIMLKGGVLKLDSDGKCPDCGEQVMKNTPDTEVQIEQIVEKVRTVEFLHGVPVELPNRTKELLRSGIREALSSRDTYWKERVNGMKLTQTKNETDVDWFFGKGYNTACDDILQALDNLK